jgi:hypothetical protein
MKPIKITVEPVSEADGANKPYVHAHLTVACLKRAWHYVLSIDPRQRADAAVDQIERALESAVSLRERLKSSS